MPRARTQPAANPAGHHGAAADHAADPALRRTALSRSDAGDPADVKDLEEDSAT